LGHFQGSPRRCSTRRSGTVVVAVRLRVLVQQSHHQRVTGGNIDPWNLAPKNIAAGRAANDRKR
jgi:hypothetical protein